MNSQPKVLVLSGDGLNCEKETALALELAGASPTIVPIHSFLFSENLESYSAIVIPGGFSFGDELGSGQVLALKIKNYRSKEIEKFLADGKVILGICNGFQVLAKLGLLPTVKGERTLAVTRNAGGHFIERWVDVKFEDNIRCDWLRPLAGKAMKMPVRHGEGRVFFQASDEQLKKWEDEGLFALRYQEDINGSWKQVAGLSDESGQVFGMMPHPEAAIALKEYARPKSVGTEGAGLVVFKSLVNYLREKRGIA